jgi:hypothetical protein
MNNLCEGLVDKIFSHLSPATLLLSRQVCKRWRTLINQQVVHIHLIMGYHRGQELGPFDIAIVELGETERDHALYARITWSGDCEREPIQDLKTKTIALVKSKLGHHMLCARWHFVPPSDQDFDLGLARLLRAHVRLLA